MVSSLGSTPHPCETTGPKVETVYMVVDPLSLRACDCGRSEGLLHTPSTGTQKKNRIPEGGGVALEVLCPHPQQVEGGGDCAPAEE